jgi:hypothetical protein
MLSQTILAQLQKFYGVSNFTQWETQDWAYYDTVYVPTAATGTDLAFFAVAAGGADPNRPAATITKTEEQTNLPVSGMIGGAECFVVMSIHFDLFPAPKARQQDSTVVAQTTFAADQLVCARWLENMSQKGVFVWEINKTTFMQENRPFRRFPPGFGLGPVIPPVIGGVTAPIQGGSNAYLSMSPYSIYDMGDIFTLDQPQFMAPNTPFTWKIQWPEGATIASTSMYNGDGTTHTKTGTMLSYAEMRGVKVRPVQ